jgi:ABC-type sugar transport system permease subunit
VKRRNALARHENRLAWLLLAPILLYFLVFQAFPVLFGFFIGFVNWVGVTTKPKFAGINNFVRFFTDPFYLKTLWNSFYIGFIVMFFNVTIGFIGALLLSDSLRGRTVFRSIWYAPAVTSAVATTQIFLMFIDPSSGIANRVIQGLGAQPVAWFYSTGWMVFWIALYSCWKGIGGAMILWLAGLQSIDPVFYEVADMNGASGWQRLIYVTLPSLRNITTFVLITGFISVLQIFDPVLFISQGGPFGTTDVIVHRVFRDFYGDFNFGMAGAGSLVITAIIFCFSLLTLRWYTGKEQ